MEGHGPRDAHIPIEKQRHGELEETGADAVPVTDLFRYHEGSYRHDLLIFGSFLLFLLAIAA